MRTKCICGKTIFLGFYLGQKGFKIKPGTVSDGRYYYNIFCDCTKKNSEPKVFRYQWNGANYDRTPVEDFPQEIIDVVLPLSKRLDFSNYKASIQEEYIEAFSNRPQNIPLLFTNEGEAIKIKEDTETMSFFEATSVPGLFDTYDTNKFGEESYHTLKWVSIAEIQHFKEIGKEVTLPEKTNFIEIL